MELLIAIGLIFLGAKFLFSFKKPAQMAVKQPSGVLWLQSSSLRSAPKAANSGSRTRSRSAPTYGGPKFAQPGEVGKLFAYGSYAGPFDLGGTYSLIDLETSGFNPPQAKILEIAILKINANGDVLEEFSTLIDPKNMEVGRTDIHGITLSMLKNAPDFAEVVGQVLKIIENSILVAHNARFEENFLASEFRGAGLDLPLLPAIDTLWLSRQILNLSDYKLDTVITSYNESIDNAHTALGDVRAMAKVLPRMLMQSDKVLFPRSFSPLPKLDTDFQSKQR